MQCTYLLENNDFLKKEREKIVTRPILNQFEKNRILYDLQYGIHQQRPFETQIISCIQEQVNTYIQITFFNKEPCQRQHSATI